MPREMQEFDFCFVLLDGSLRELDWYGSLLALIHFLVASIDIFQYYINIWDLGLIVLLFVMLNVFH